MNTLLIVRNLSLNVTAKQLAALFSQAGEVVDVFLITDRWTATPKGVAVVQMESEDDAENAIRLVHCSEYAHRTLMVRFITPEDESVIGFKPDQMVAD